MKAGKFTLHVLPLALGLAMLAAGCKGQEKAKPAPAPARPAPPAAAPAAPAPRAEAPPPAAPPPRARTGGKVVKSVTTAQGKLHIVRYGKGRSAEFAAVLGDRSLVEPEARPIEVAAKRPAKGKATLVLLRFPRADKGCPARFRVADLARGDPRVSDEFGNCSAHPRASGSAGGWKLAFPRSKGASPKTWIYANGELREMATKGSSKKGSSKTASGQVPPGYKVPEYTGPQPSQ